jgi:hypothetical protein
MIRLPEQTADRIETTKMLIHQRNASQELDEEICNFDDAASTQQSSNQSRRRQRSQSSQRDEESRPRTRTTTAQTRAAARRPMERQIVTIKLRDEFRVETNYTMTKTTPLSNVFELYSERVLNGLCSTNLRFLLDGDRIEPSQTPIMLGVGDEATIDVMFGLPDYSVVIVDPKDLKVKGSTDGVYIRVPWILYRIPQLTMCHTVGSQEGREWKMFSKHMLSVSVFRRVSYAFFCTGNALTQMKPSIR